jgi:asparagine synthase (glutamine-hydrolysing)
LNGIFGLFNLDGEPAAVDQLAAMREALAFWAIDGASQWSVGEIGMGCLHLASTPEAVGEQLPLHDAASGLTLTAGARLDNRGELLKQLKIETDRGRAAVTDGEIILGAYQKWGQECVHHLDGDWHFAIWDEGARSLFLARDHHGNTGLYYYHGPRFFAFASSKKALLALDAVPKEPDLLRISQVLVAWPGDGVATGYEHVRRLPPAHRMSVTAGKAEAERYWFPENVSDLRLESDDEYVDAFLEVFTRAVSVRLRSRHPVGVTLSGGLDSGSVMAVASRLLGERSESLVAFTSVPLGDPSSFTGRDRFGDETQLARASAHYAGDLEHHLVRSESVSPLTGIERTLWIHDEPVHAAGNFFWITALLEAARRRAVGALLTGQMGNATISWSGAGENLLPAILKGDMVGFWRALETARRSAGLGYWRGVRRFFLRPVVLPLVLQLQFQFNRRWQPVTRPWRKYSAIRSDFARSIRIGQRMSEAGYVAWVRNPDPVQHRLRVIRPGQATLGAFWSESGAAHGLEVRDPTQDRRVIEFCQGIPEDQFQRGGVDRRLIRRAMQGYLPDEVRLNARRGLQAADIGQRVLDNREEVEAAMAKMEQHDLTRHVLDLPRMANVLASMQRRLTPQNTVDCRTILMRGLMTGKFLLRF